MNSLTNLNMNSYMNSEVYFTYLTYMILFDLQVVIYNLTGLAAKQC